MLKVTLQIVLPGNTSSPLPHTTVSRGATPSLLRYLNEPKRAPVRYTPSAPTTESIDWTTAA